MPLTIVTIGVYGFDAPGFFSALQAARVDTFCDLRARRGVRGAACAFANSRRLQTRLAELGIRYVHLPDLAPSAALRNAQATADRKAGLTKRQRTALSPEFIAGYTAQCLQHFHPAEFVERLGADARVAALFCVEREAAACHRSLIAERLEIELGLKVNHLSP
jgi:hypothetical protein